MSISMIDNLRIWSQVEKTDPDHVKEVNFGRKFSAICAYSQIKKATEVWGPIGSSWGYTARNEIVQGCFLVELTLWYMDGEKRCEVPGIVEMVKFTTKKGVDTDSGKKALTGALTKALSYCGFNADIFTGKFEDSKYVNDLREQKAREAEKHTDNLIGIANNIHRKLPQELNTTDVSNFVRQSIDTRVDKIIQDCIDWLKTAIDNHEQGQNNE